MDIYWTIGWAYDSRTYTLQATWQPYATSSVYFPQRHYETPEDALEEYRERERAHPEYRHHLAMTVPFPASDGQPGLTAARAGILLARSGAYVARLAEQLGVGRRHGEGTRGTWAFTPDDIATLRDWITTNGRTTRSATDA